MVGRLGEGGQPQGCGRRGGGRGLDEGWMAKGEGAVLEVLTEEGSNHIGHRLEGDQEVRGGRRRPRSSGGQRPHAT